MCRADCWPVWKSGTENMVASDSSLEYARPPRSHPTWWFFVAGKTSSRLRLGLNIQLLGGFLARTEMLALAGVDFLVLVGRKRDREISRSPSVVVRDFCSLPVRAHRCPTVSSSVHWKFVSYHFLTLVPWKFAHFSEVYCKCSNALFEQQKRDQR